MKIRSPSRSAIFLLLLAASPCLAAGGPAAPLSIGDTFTLKSRVLNEPRRINVYTPSYYGEAIGEPLPVLYMPDGGIHEDFLHVAGLIDVSVVNGTMRPFLLVGIENTERRRDLTPPSQDPEDMKIAPRIGGSAKFREFLSTELMPEITARYDITDETAIIGESLAGLFVVDTYFHAPQLFDTYIAIDPSLWWNREELVNTADARLKTGDHAGHRLHIASSAEPTIIAPAAKLAAVLRRQEGKDIKWNFAPLPNEAHHTVYHPAALKAFRELFPRMEAQH